MQRKYFEVAWIDHIQDFLEVHSGDPEKDGVVIELIEACVANPATNFNFDFGRRSQADLYLGNTKGVRAASGFSVFVGAFLASGANKRPVLKDFQPAASQKKKKLFSKLPKLTGLVKKKHQNAETDSIDKDATNHSSEEQEEEQEEDDEDMQQEDSGEDEGVRNSDDEDEEEEKDATAAGSGTQEDERDISKFETMEFSKLEEFMKTNKVAIQHAIMYKKDAVKFEKNVQFALSLMSQAVSVPKFSQVTDSVAAVLEETSKDAEWYQAIVDIYKRRLENEQEEDPDVVEASGEVTKLSESIRKTVQTIADLTASMKNAEEEKTRLEAELQSAKASLDIAKTATEQTRKRKLEELENVDIDTMYDAPSTKKSK